MGNSPSPKEKMKCFIVLASLAMASAAPQFYIADTPEVQAAKAQFAAAWNAAAQRNTIAPAPVEVQRTAAYNFAPVVQAAPIATAGLFEDGQTWPEAEAYVHEEISAEPYVHIEPAFNAAPVAVAAPVQAAAPVQYANYAPVQAAAPVQYANYAPVQQFAPVAQVAAGCFNWKGEGVPCRY